MTDIMAALRDLASEIRTVLSRLDKRTRDADKEQWRNSISATKSMKISAETNRNYWMTQEFSVSLTVKADDDEPNKLQTLEELEGVLDEQLERFEKKTNIKYNLGKTPIKKSQPVKARR